MLSRTLKDSIALRLLRYYVLDNPVYRREVGRRWYRRTAKVVWPLAVGAVVLGVAALGPLRAYAGGAITENGLGWGLAAIFFIDRLIFLTLAPAVASLIAREHSKRTFESLAATRLTSRQIVAGKMAAVLLPMGALVGAWLVLSIGYGELWRTVVASGPSARALPDTSAGELALRLLSSWIGAGLYLLFLSSVGALSGGYFRLPPLAVGAAALVSVLCAAAPFLEARYLPWWLYWGPLWRGPWMEALQGLLVILLRWGIYLVAPHENITIFGLTARGGRWIM